VGPAGTSCARDSEHGGGTRWPWRSSYRRVREELKLVILPAVGHNPPDPSHADAENEIEDGADILPSEKVNESAGEAQGALVPIGLGRCRSVTSGRRCVARRCARYIRLSLVC
jgi:hypothetical protein